MKQPSRSARVERVTKETSITVEVNLDGEGVYNVSTGMGFLDHMLEQLSRHSLIDITLKAEGDLDVTFHHTTEDTGIALGEAVSQALADRRGIQRYGSAFVPMDSGTDTTTHSSSMNISRSTALRPARTIQISLIVHSPE